MVAGSPPVTVKGVRHPDNFKGAKGRLVQPEGKGWDLKTCNKVLDGLAFPPNTMLHFLVTGSSVHFARSRFLLILMAMNLVVPMCYLKYTQYVVRADAKVESRFIVWDQHPYMYFGVCSPMCWTVFCSALALTARWLK